jgi:hypothetical protein
VTERALNEALFRDVNERIAESAERVDENRTGFVCECADPNCTDRVPATLAEYESVRKQSTTFPSPRATPSARWSAWSRIEAASKSEKVQAAVRRAVTRLDHRRRPAPSES